MTDRITHAARSRWERGQTRISGRYVHMRWDELKPDVRDALVEEMRLTAADLEPAVEAVGERTMTMGEWQDISTAPKDGTRILLRVAPRAHLGDTTEHVAIGRWRSADEAPKSIPDGWKWQGWSTDLGPFSALASGWMALPTLPPPPNTGKGEGV